MIDPNWNDMHAKGHGIYPSENLVRFLCRLKRDKPEFIGCKVLDLGCGAGANTKMMLQEGFDVFAVDGSENAIKNTIAFTGISPDKAKVMDFDALDLEPFDIIVDNASICCMNPPDAILAKVKTLLKPNGYFYSSLLTFPMTRFPCPQFLTEEEARATYAKYFTIVSFDTLRYTEYNQKEEVRLVNMICQ